MPYEYTSCVAGHKLYFHPFPNWLPPELKLNFPRRYRMWRQIRFRRIHAECLAPLDDRIGTSEEEKA